MRTWVIRGAVVGAAFGHLLAAESPREIEGAFGYRLGQIMPGAELSVSITPEKPLRPFFEYELLVSPKTRVAYTIVASGPIRISPIDWQACIEALEGVFGKGATTEERNWLVTRGDRYVAAIPARGGKQAMLMIGDRGLERAAEAETRELARAATDASGLLQTELPPVPQKSAPLPTPSPAPTPRPAETVEESKRLAVERYPEIGIAGAPHNLRFLEAVRRARIEEPARFAEVTWPERIARETAPPDNPTPGGTWRTPKPGYPVQARAMRITGSGVCRVTTGPTGQVISATMSPGIHPLLDETVEKFARANWHGPPNTSKGVPVTFTLREE